MHLDRTADRRRELAASTFEGNDDIVGAELRVIDDFFGPDNPERDMNAV